ncbi:fluoride efflux transporter FluC [Actinoplanes sp. URMC 104]|uniref:fluoride efflux transporter FluC n=1 Tax=Actinoplanes sp. URMC 104 TaxID=3423409 RepID=UPI003F1C1870
MDGRTLGVISAGGVLGALARYGLTVAWPHPAGGFGWAVWLVNVSGCFLAGLLAVWIARFLPDRRHVRPFLVTGFLGGYTTFSTAMTDVVLSPTVIGLVYLLATLAGALLAVWAGSALAARMPR